RRLIDARGKVRPAIATHNLRSLAHAMAYLERCGGEPAEIELQVLRGLGDEIAAGLARLGHRVRVYTPIGDLVAGMAYLVRRLLGPRLIIGGGGEGGDTETSVDPCEPAREVARLRWASEDEASRALDLALGSRWPERSVEERARVLERAADLAAERRDRLAAL